MDAIAECAEYHYIESLKSIKQLQINAHIYGVITAPNRKTENAVDAMVNFRISHFNKRHASLYKKDFLVEYFVYMSSFRLGYPPLFSR